MALRAFRVWLHVAVAKATEEEEEEAVAEQKRCCSLFSLSFALCVVPYSSVSRGALLCCVPLRAYGLW